MRSFITSYIESTINSLSLPGSRDAEPAARSRPLSGIAGRSWRQEGMGLEGSRDTNSTDSSVYIPPAARMYCSVTGTKHTVIITHGKAVFKKVQFPCSVSSSNPEYLQ